MKKVKNKISKTATTRLPRPSRRLSAELTTQSQGKETAFQEQGPEHNSIADRNGGEVADTGSLSN